MSTALELIEALKQVDIEAITVKVVADNADNYILLNQAQMSEGEGREKKIGTYKDFRMPNGKQYRDYKYDKYPTAGRGNVDLRDSMDFYKGMKMKVSGKDIEVSSSDWKEGDLLRRYGGQIYGLNEKNKPIFSEVAVLPDLQAEITKITGLKFN